MRIIQDICDKIRPDFEKGGKFERFYPLLEAHETFLFSPGTATSSGSHVRDLIDSKRLMSTVIISLVPCLLFGIYNVGYQYYRAKGIVDADIQNIIVVGLWYVMPIVITSYAVGGVWELVFALVRKHEINEGFLVTGMLFPLTLAPTVPLWQVALGISFGVVIGKEVFGGTGMNIFNPALVGRAFLFFAYPAQISGDKVWTALPDVQVDGYSGATPLLVAATNDGVAVVERLNSFGTNFTDFSLCNTFIGLIPGSIGETSALAGLMGAAILIVTGVGSWQIMLSVILGGLFMTLVLNGCAPKADPGSFLHLPFWYHFASGGFVFGMVYMATDPVSAAGTAKGKWIYGFLIGMLAILIRVINPAYPEGMMLAILFMNAFAPLIDYFVLDRHIAWRMKRAQA